MCLRTINPKPMPRKVAIKIPKMPARIPGTTKELHPLAVAIPHAVVGPPIWHVMPKFTALSLSEMDNY